MRALGFLSAILLLGCQRPAPIAAISYADLRLELPAELRPTRAAVPAARNGWTLTLPAKGELRAAGDWQRLIGANQSDPSVHAAARRAVQGLAKPLGRVQAAVAMNDWQAPVRDLGEDFNDFATFKSLAKALVLRAETRVKDGDDRGAIEDLLLVRSLSDRIASAGENVIVYLVAVAIRQIGNRALADAAIDPRVSLAALDSALPRVPEGARTDPWLPRALVGEASVFVAGLARMSGPVDENVKSAVDRILRDHPNRLDLRATVRLYGEAIGEEIANTGRTWNDQRASKRSGDLLRDWPKNVDDEDAPPTSAQIESAQRALHGVPNALGRKMVADTLNVFENLNVASFVARSSDSATRTILLLARERKGGGKLEVIPRDPFSDGPMRFDRARNVVWSVGPDGKDGGGAGKPYRRDGADLVWPIQPVKKPVSKGLSNP